jgi:hypothetical protein
LNEVQRLKRIDDQVNGAIDNNPQNIEFVIQVFNLLKAENWPSALAEIHKMKTAIEELPNLRRKLNMLTSNSEINRAELDLYSDILETMDIEGSEHPCDAVARWKKMEKEHKNLVTNNISLCKEIEQLKKLLASSNTSINKLNNILSIINISSNNERDIYAYTECLVKDHKELIEIKNLLNFTDYELSAIENIKEFMRLGGLASKMAPGSNFWESFKHETGIKDNVALQNEIRALFKLREDIRDSSDYQPIPSNVAAFDYNDHIECKIIQTLRDYQKVRELLNETLTPVNIEQLRDKIHLLSIYEESRTIPWKDAVQFGELKAALARWDKAA